MDDRLWVALLFIAAAALPILGFGRLLVRAQRVLSEARAKVRERGHDHITWDDLDNPNPILTFIPLEERNSVIWDIFFVGSGLIAGAVASIWSLFPSW